MPRVGSKISRSTTRASYQVLLNGKPDGYGRYTQVQAKAEAAWNREQGADSRAVRVRSSRRAKAHVRSKPRKKGVLSWGEREGGKVADFSDAIYRKAAGKKHNKEYR